jgi:hypothetical protein
MLKRKSAIKPYGRDWNGDRSAPDYDPQRDPWNPESPVYRRWPRPNIFREFILKSPIFWAFGAWFTATISLVALDYFRLISPNTFLVGWLARYAVLFAGFAIAGIWSLVTWLRKTPAGERGPAVGRAIKRVPGFLTWFIPLYAVMVALDRLKKHEGVPFFLSTAGLVGIILIALVIQAWREKRARPALREEHERKVIETLSNDPADAEGLAMYRRELEWAAKLRQCPFAVDLGDRANNASILHDWLRDHCSPGEYVKVASGWRAPNTAGWRKKWEPRGPQVWFAHKSAAAAFAASFGGRVRYHKQASQYAAARFMHLQSEALL